MVQFVPARDDWAQAFRSIGQGVSEGYTQRSDEKAIQNAIMKLGPKASAKDILDALTNTKTYSPAAKQNAFKNYLGAEEFEELQRQHTAAEKLKKDEIEAKNLEKKEKQDRLRTSASALVENSELSPEKKKELLDQISKDQLEYATVESLVKPLKKDNQEGKRIEKIAQLKSGLLAVQDMINIGDKGNLGWGLGLRKLYSSEANEDSGRYEQLGKSLIQLSTTIPIRNRQEFETLAHKLYDPSIRDAERKGVLTALQSILNRSLLEIENDQGETQPNKAIDGKIKVRNKQTGQTGSVTPFEGMDAKYERI